MHRVIWLTDLHLNHCADLKVSQLFQKVNERSPDSIWISGDFSESFQLTRYMKWIEHEFACPVYFVMGNHDFYFSTVNRIRDEIGELSQQSSTLCYLTDESDPISINNGTCLIGHDGWADGRLGDFEKSLVMMHDYQAIGDLAGLDKKSRWDKIKQLGDEAACAIESRLLDAIKKFKTIYILTHVPPTRCSCWHNGTISDDHWAPHFTCKAMGDAIKAVASSNPEKKFIVLCGHTHGEGESNPLFNLKILTGKAEYGQPAITAEFELE